MYLDFIDPLFVAIEKFFYLVALIVLNPALPATTAGIFWRSIKRFNLTSS